MTAIYKPSYENLCTSYDCPNELATERGSVYVNQTSKCVNSGNEDSKESMLTQCLRLPSS